MLTTTKTTRHSNIEQSLTVASSLATTVANHGAPDASRKMRLLHFANRKRPRTAKFEKDIQPIQEEKARKPTTTAQDIEQLELAIRQGSANVPAAQFQTMDNAKLTPTDRQMFDDGGMDKHELDDEYDDLGSLFYRTNENHAALRTSHNSSDGTNQDNSARKQGEHKMKMTNREIEQLELAIRQGSINTNVVAT
ncbi:hypothetical protein KFU94_23805 [Chloroflexi bacterium TSY]|nr:hypothetical protein [Chloroflexi bacterium TSY]